MSDMGFNFVSAGLDQPFLLPPDMREWLPGDHLVWTVLDAVGQIDLGRFRARYRADGHGRAAYDPAVMVGLLLFAYCDGVRSSRRIERLAQRDVAYRVAAGNLFPDHATIARFRKNHAESLTVVFTHVLRLCAEAGLVDPRLIAVDGTKLIADAAGAANRTAAQLDADIARRVKQMLAEAETLDAAEDADEDDDQDGPSAELVAELADRDARLARLVQAKARLDAEDQARRDAHQVKLDRREAARAAGKPVKGRPPGDQPPPAKDNRCSERANTTDPDSRIMKTRTGFVQGYNAQLVADRNQIILAADLTQSSADVAALHPMLTTARANLDAAGVTTPIRVALADAGYASEANFTTDCEPLLLVAVAAEREQTGRAEAKPAPPASKPARERMRRRLDSTAGRALYKRRSPTIEPVIGQLLGQLGRRLHLRGLAAATSELHLMAASHNLLKLWRNHPATA
jgi:transposase